MEGTLVFLGTGGSTGVPMIACSCSTCLSDNEKNKRLRCSVLLEVANKKIVIDVGPDFRMQALRHHITRLDGVIITHSHFDHISGLDELRAFYVIQRHILPVLASEETLIALKKRYDYLFVEQKDGRNLTAQLDFQALPAKMGRGKFCDLPFHYVSYSQAEVGVNGFRFGSIAYLTDIKEISDEVLQELQGVEVLIMSALKEQTSKVHLSFKEAIDFSKKIQPKQTYFTHLGHETDYDATSRNLPKGYALAYDGLQIPFTI